MFGFFHLNSFWQKLRKSTKKTDKYTLTSRIGACRILFKLLCIRFVTLISITPSLAYKAFEALLKEKKNSTFGFWNRLVCIWMCLYNMKWKRVSAKCMRPTMFTNNYKSNCNAKKQLCTQQIQEYTKKYTSNRFQSFCLFSHSFLFAWRFLNMHNALFFLSLSAQVDILWKKQRMNAARHKLDQYA